MWSGNGNVRILFGFGITSLILLDIKKHTQAIHISTPVCSVFVRVVQYVFCDVTRVCTIYIYMCQMICMLRPARHPTPPRSHPTPTHARRGGRLCRGNVYQYLLTPKSYKKIRLSYYTILPPLVQTLLSTDLRFAFLRFIIGFMGEERSHWFALPHAHDLWLTYE